MSDDSMRDRLILPVLIPVGALAFILFLALVMSQVLLNVPNAVAVAIATFTAINLLIAFSVLALKPKTGRMTTMFVGAIAAVPLVLGAAAAAGVVPLPEEEEQGAGGEEASVTLAANGLQFDKKELAIPADTEFTLVFNNQEAQPHNVAILEAQGSSNALFRGQIVTGPKEAEETVDAIPAGEYYFRCDVHPNMNGTVTAEGGGDSGGGDSGGGEASAEED